MRLLAYKVKGTRFDFRESKFPYHPSPQGDELLSSWIVRTALRHLTEPATFVNLYFPEWRNVLWTRDIDISASEDFLEALAQRSGFDYETLHSLTLRTYEGYLTERIKVDTGNPFIRPLGNHSRIKVGYGLRFCPQCLKEDKVPYFRKKWRLSFSTACVAHKCFLLDRCPACGTPLTLSRSYKEYQFPNCRKCGVNVAKVESEPILNDSYGLTAIKALYDILDSGLFRFGDRNVYSFFFFKVLRQLVKAVCRGRLDRGLLDHEIMAGKAAFTFDRPRQNNLDSLPLKAQYLLFSGLMKIFENFPSDFITFCKNNRLAKTELTRDLKYVPFWYKEIIDPLSKEFNRINCEEVASVIEYLKKRDTTVTRQKVAKIMGVYLYSRERKDMEAVFKGAGILLFKKIESLTGIKV